MNFKTNYATLSNFSESEDNSTEVDSEPEAANQKPDMISRQDPAVNAKPDIADSRQIYILYEADDKKTDLGSESKPDVVSGQETIIVLGPEMDAVSEPKSDVVSGPEMDVVSCPADVNSEQKPDGVSVPEVISEEDSQQSNPPMQQCPHCPYQCKRSDTLKIHVLCVHTSDSRPFPCNFCEKRFKLKVS